MPPSSATSYHKQSGKQFSSTTFCRHLKAHLFSDWLFLFSVGWNHCTPTLFCVFWRLTFSVYFLFVISFSTLSIQANGTMCYRSGYHHHHHQHLVLCACYRVNWRSTTCCPRICLLWMMEDTPWSWRQPSTTSMSPPQYKLYFYLTPFLLTLTKSLYCKFNNVFSLYIHSHTILLFTHSYMYSLIHKCYYFHQNY